MGSPLGVFENEDPRESVQVVLESLVVIRIVREGREV
jgi:hypothetical protein